MASGLQCPGCGHVHPAGLPEIARGDATFRCYGCYRTLSIPEGWTGRPAPRPPVPRLTGDAPPGAGMRDARSARLAGRRGGRAGAPTGGGPSVPADLPTQMVPPATAGGGASASAPDWSGTGAGPAGWSGAERGATAAAGSTGTAWPEVRAARSGTAGVAPPSGTAADWRAADRPGTRPGAARAGARSSSRSGAAPLGWTVPEQPRSPVAPGIRAAVWMGALAIGLVIAAFVLRKAGLLDVNTVIDLYAGSGPGRFAILATLLPLWAVVSATIAHVSLEALARRRHSRTEASEPDDSAETSIAR